MNHMSEGKCNDNNTPNSNELSILAFSDWHVQSIDALVEFVKSLKPKPDLIFYGGDGFERFESLSEQLLFDLIKENDQSFEDSKGEVVFAPTTISSGKYITTKSNRMMLFCYHRDF